MAASLLAPGRSVIHNVPNILDVAVMGQLLRQLGCTVEIAYPGDADPTCEPTSGRATIDVPEELDAQGPLRAGTPAAGLDRRAGPARRPMRPGERGAARRRRDRLAGLDMHILGLQELGAVVRIEHGQVVAEVPDGLRGANLWLDFPSVGATENLVMAAVLARGDDGHRQRGPRAGDHRPVRDARRDGGRASTGSPPRRSSIEGVDRLHPVEHTTVTDRIVAGTWVFASAIAGGDLHISGGVAAPPRHRARQAGRRRGPRSSRRETGFTRAHRPPARAPSTWRRCPTPGSRPTCSRSRWRWPRSRAGTAMITENVFEARFMFAQELARLGADLRTDGHHAVVRGRADAVGRAGRGPRHPRGRRPGAGRAGGRRAPPRWPSRSTSTAATRGSPRRSPRSAPRSAGWPTEPDLEQSARGVFPRLARASRQLERARRAPIVGHRHGRGAPDGPRGDTTIARRARRSVLSGSLDVRCTAEVATPGLRTARRGTRRRGRRHRPGRVHRHDHAEAARGRQPGC